MANRKSARLNEAKFSYTEDFVIKDAEKIYVGNMVSRDANGEVLESSDAASVVVLGISTKEVDNTDDGLKLNFVSTAIHLMDNSVSGTFTDAHIGQVAYVEDEATVSSLSGTNALKAGKVVEVTADGVYIDFDPAKRDI